MYLYKLEGNLTQWVKIFFNHFLKIFLFLSRILPFITMTWVMESMYKYPILLYFQTWSCVVWVDAPQMFALFNTTVAWRFISQNMRLQVKNFYFTSSSCFWYVHFMHLKIVLAHINGKCISCWFSAFMRTPIAFYQQFF